MKKYLIIISTFLTANTNSVSAQNTSAQNCADATRILNTAQNCYSLMFNYGNTNNTNIKAEMEKLCGSNINGNATVLNSFYRSPSYINSNGNWRQELNTSLASYTNNANNICNAATLQTNNTVSQTNTIANTQITALGQQIKAKEQELLKLQKANCKDQALPKGASSWTFNENATQKCKIVCKSDYKTNDTATNCIAVNKPTSTTAKNSATFNISENTNNSAKFCAEVNDINYSITNLDDQITTLAENIIKRTNTTEEEITATIKSLIGDINENDYKNNQEEKVQTSSNDIVLIATLITTASKDYTEATIITKDTKDYVNETKKRKDTSDKILKEFQKETRNIKSNNPDYMITLAKIAAKYYEVFNEYYDLLIIAKELTEKQTRKQIIIQSMIKTYGKTECTNTYF